MVYGFAKQSGGVFRIRSREGAGTDAEIWLPRGREAVVEAAVPRGRPASQSSVGRLRVLLVDDHDAVRTTTAAMLDDLGHEAIPVSDGAEAIAALERGEAIDVLITDYAMPLVSGAEVIRQARALRPELPALIITGYADASSIARRPADVHLLSKPFTAEQMRLALEAAMRAEPPPSEAALQATG